MRIAPAAAPRPRRTLFERALLIALASCSSTPDTSPEATPRAGANIQLDRNKLSVGAVVCGQSQTSGFNVTNHGATPSRWTASVEPTELFKLSSTEGELAAGESRMIAIEAKAVAGLVRPGTASAGIVRVVTQEPSTREMRIAVEFEARGAWLELPVGIDFGFVPLAAPVASATIRIANTGTDAARIALDIDKPSPFWLPGETAADVAAGSTVELAASFRAREGGAIVGTARIRADGPTCNRLPESLPVLASVTGTSVAAEPGTVDFGESACGIKPPHKTLVLRNYGLTPMEWSASLASGSLYAITPSSGVIPPDQRVEIDVATIGDLTVPGMASETLNIVTSEATLPVTLTQRKLGGVLSYVGGDELSAGRQKLGTTTSIAPELRNTGSAPVTVDFTVAGGADLFVPSSASLTIPPGASAKLPVDVHVKAVSEREATLTLTTTSALCAPLPMMRLRGYGFARASRAYGASCFLLDDGQSVFCHYGATQNGVIGTIPANATLMPDAFRYQTCFRAPQSIVPTCFEATSAQERPEWTGIQSIREGYELRDDGTVHHAGGGGAVSGLTEVVEIVAAVRQACALRVGGSVECWGDGRLIEGLTGTFAVDATTRFKIPGLSARQIALIEYPSGILCALRLDEKVECWGLDVAPSGYSVIVPVPSQAKRLQTQRNGPGLCVLDSSGHAYCGRPPSTLVALQANDIVDITDGAVVLSDGRVMRYYPSVPTVSSLEGFD